MHAFHPAQHGTWLRYLDLAGLEPATVYLHGFGAASTADFPQVERIRLCGRRSLCVNLLGHGLGGRPAHFSYSLDAHALHASAVGQLAGTKPSARRLLPSLPIPPTFVSGSAPCPTPMSASALAKWR
jgi:pimeloyl-ACP methyl ester carboxylesterase